MHQLAAKSRTKDFVEDRRLKEVLESSSSNGASYPLLQPVTFTNIVEDDYLESGVWCLK
jgi:hypothetical protein